MCYPQLAELVILSTTILNHKDTRGPSPNNPILQEQRKADI